MSDFCAADAVAKAEYGLENWHGADKLTWDEYRVVCLMGYQFRLKCARAGMRALAGHFADPVVRDAILRAAAIMIPEAECGGGEVPNAGNV